MATDLHRFVVSVLKRHRCLMDGRSLLTLIALVFGVASTIGVVWAVTKSNLAVTTSALWKAEAEATKAKADRLDSEHTKCQERLTILERSHEELWQRFEDAFRNPNTPSMYKPTRARKND